MIKSFAIGVIRFRILILVVTVLLVALAGSGGRFIEFSSNYRNFFCSANPQLTAFDELQNAYSKNDNVMFVVAPKDGKVFTRETLSAVEWLTQESWQIPYSRRVDSITNFQHTRADGDSLIVSSLVEDAANLSDGDLERVKKVARFK